MKCENCKAFRSRLKQCSVCGKRLCGCCSIKPLHIGKVVCCYPGDAGACAKIARERIRDECTSKHTD